MTVGTRHGAAEDGLGLVEVLLSMAVLLTVLVSATYLVDNVVQQAAVNRQKVAATELAEKYLEVTANSTLATLQSQISRDVLLTATPVNIGGINYSVWSHLEWAATGASPSLCTSGNPPQVVRATITVKWAPGQSLGETTIVNPPYGAIVPGDGFLSVQIQGATAPKPPADTAALTNVRVSVTPSGGSATVYNPDQYGCVYLEEPVGTYAVSLSSPSGGPAFIDWQENVAPGQPSVSVATAGLPAFVPAFHYDEAATVALSPQAGAPAASNMPVSVSNGGNLQPSGTAVVVAAGTNGTSAQLFPYTTPYSIWYGDCTTVGGTTPEEPATPTTFTAAPQGSVAASISGLVVLSLSVTDGAGFTTVPNNATAQVADPGAPSDGCPATADAPYGLAGFTGSGTTYGDQTAILPQTYTVTIPYNGTTKTFSMQVTPTGVVYGGTTYPIGTPVPLTVP